MTDHAPLTEHDPPRTKPIPVGERLFKEPQAFEFTQALMLLERMRPEATPLGTGIDPRREAVRLRGPLSPVFAVSALSKLERGIDGKAPVLTAQLFGLGGPDGPLPYAYQEWLQLRALRKDHGPAEFLDLFQHRLLSLLYRARCKYRVAPSFAPPAQSPAYRMLQSLVGLLPRPLQDRQDVPDAAILARTALFANQRRSLAGFEVIVRNHFGVAVRLSQFEGGWRDIPPVSRSTLGQHGRNRSLGRNAVAGRRVWDEHAGIRITLGPMSQARCRDFLPGGTPYTALVALAAFYFGPDLRCNLTLLLPDGEARPASLNRTDPPRLSWGSWLGRQEGERRIDTTLVAAKEPT
ncbi:type VI secretion system baseplate subunit TssG [Andreprevotia chitinilytica]|uniref:type VI secretion system baseplate subunit TssG n=1 Tax=Andreprevotia chitinilytica TaxID=396808 RepID=UPI00068F94FA|nr:type VI secretion system baseplate subunit TssG [Andreprevotia chitinilytica]